MTQQDHGSRSAANWIVCACVLTCCWSCLAFKEIKVKPGGDAVLSCQDPRGPDVEGSEWRRPEHQNMVVFWLNGKFLYQDLSFKDRVVLRDPDTKDGDISVVLKNVDQSDAGTYECYLKRGDIFKLGSGIRIRVTAPPQIRVKPGADVALPCRVPRGSGIDLVKWIRLDPEQDVFTWRNQSDYEYDYNPDESFSGRMKLMEPSMEGGEVSVVLRNVSLNDSGVYKCYVGKSNTLTHQLISAITLTVSHSGLEPGRSWDLGKLVTIISLTAVVLVHFFGIRHLMMRKRRKPRMRRSNGPPETHINEYADELDALETQN